MAVLAVKVRQTVALNMKNIKVSECIGLANGDTSVDADPSSTIAGNLHVTFWIHLRRYWSNGDDLSDVSHDVILTID